MAEEQDSLKAEMSELLRGDLERARERRHGSPVAEPPVAEQPAETEAEPLEEPRPGLGGRLRKLFG